jgi:hypothetical protein
LRSGMPDPMPGAAAIPCSRSNTTLESSRAVDREDVADIPVSNPIEHADRLANMRSSLSHVPGASVPMRGGWSHLWGM